MQKQTTPPPSSKLSFEDLYNILMFEIEPELTTDAVPMLDELYKDETPEQQKLRGARYQLAFLEIDARLGIFLGAAKRELMKIKKTLLRGIEVAERSQEQTNLGDVEQGFVTAP